MKAAKGEQARRLKDAAKFADSALLRLEALRLGRDLPGCAGENADLHLLAVSDLLDALELAAVVKAARAAGPGQGLTVARVAQIFRSKGGGK